MATTVPARLNAREGRRFGVQVGLAFAVLGAVSAWRQHFSAAAVLGGIGGLLFLAGLVVPGHLGPIHRAWMSLAAAISRVTTPIFLGIVYFLVVTPIGWLLRIVGHRPLAPTPGAPSAWTARDAAQGPRSDLTRQF